jgi:hypothetical protein
MEPVLSGLRHCGDVDRGYVVLTAAPVVLVLASEDVLPLNALYEDLPVHCARENKKIRTMGATVTTSQRRNADRAKFNSSFWRPLHG